MCDWKLSGIYTNEISWQKWWTDQLRYATHLSFGDNLILLLKVQYLFCVMPWLSNERVLSNKLIIWFISCWLPNIVFSMYKHAICPILNWWTLCIIISVQNYYIEYQCWHKSKYLHCLITVFYSPIHRLVFRKWKNWDFCWANSYTWNRVWWKLKKFEPNKAYICGDTGEIKLKNFI